MEPQIVKLTVEEQKAIKSLHRLAKTWPKSLSLFGWSGSLNIFKKAPDGRYAVVDSEGLIYCDGGDPSDDEVDQFAVIKEETK